ncbi:hypothetical protein OIV83_006233 [Microbotryomycetes sp. JL201]|nr:hypothetical protein OIV83_006233 [Microbotryomycetes sp. JL201]
MVVYAITGASRGIGFGYAKKLLESSNDGAVIALVRDLSGAKELSDLKSKYGDRLAIVKHDVSSEDSAKEAAKQVEQLGIAKNGVDVLINNAGVNVGGPKTVLDDGLGQDLQANLDVNLFGQIYTTTAFLRLLRKGNKKQIWFLSTGLASIGFDFGFGPGIAAYSISKTALNMYARKLSDVLKGEGFKTLLLSPGYVVTDMNGGNGAITVEQAAEDAQVAALTTCFATLTNLSLHVIHRSYKLFSKEDLEDLTFYSNEGTVIPW